jgi:hypothetical protein
MGEIIVEWKNDRVIITKKGLVFTLEKFVADSHYSVEIVK